MSNKTYKQQLIDLLTNEVEIVSKQSFSHNRVYTKLRLIVYIKKVNALPANAIIPKKFRHPVINSIYLFKPELINKLYDKNQN